MGRDCTDRSDLPCDVGAKFSGAQARDGTCPNLPARAHRQSRHCRQSHVESCMTDTATFERHRAHLRNIAYRMLGEMAAAEDVVQEAWLRWRRVNTDVIRDPRAWLSAA